MVSSRARANRNHRRASTGAFCFARVEDRGSFDSPAAGRSPRSIRRRGFTLIELMVVAAIIVILAALAIPSISAITSGANERAAVTSLRSLMGSARALAATTQRYVAVRFQQDAKGQSYAVLLQQPSTADQYFPNGCPPYEPNCTFLTFKVNGQTQPVVLPAGVEFAAGDIDTGNADDPSLWVAPNPGQPNATGNVPATTFCIVFSPSGQIVRRRAHVSQNPDIPPVPNTSPGVYDTVFNMTAGEPNGAGLLKPDVVDSASPPATGPLDSNWDPPNRPSSPTPEIGTNPGDGWIAPMSQNSIWIYERQPRLDAGNAPYSGYIKVNGLKVAFNTYTGAPVVVNR